MANFDNLETLKFEVNEGIAVVTLNRPMAGNAFNLKMGEELKAVLQEVNENPEIRVMVTTGAGDMFFCGGGDMQMLTDVNQNPVEAVEVYKKAGIFIPDLYNLTKPCIAAVNGFATGAGTSLALAHDFILASDNARFGANFISIAFTPDSGATYLMAQALNKQRLAELMFTGRVIKADQAKEWGIFNHVYPKDTFWDEVMKMAKRIANQPPLAIRYDKILLREAFKNDLFTQADLEASMNGILITTDDFLEGIKSAMATMRGEKYKPTFTGK
ncbi:MAG TPA: enoyl-CoA hydratase/isomerase family protein [Syntrophomonadaceae bacterium]|nr:enoyl-CoA hydratase/isomerase family protein [Syntrophomonadaceae bacterium]